MAQFFDIHPDTPQVRLVRRAVEIVQAGGVIVYPTDSTYALGCAIGDKDAVERIRAIRQLSEQHNMTLVCRDLSEITTYARIDNQSYRLLRAFTPGAYTFIFQATKQVPKRLQHPKRKTIGIRVPGHVITEALLTELGEPMISTTLQLPQAENPLTDPQEIRQALDSMVDGIIDGGFCGLQETTVVDLSGDNPQVLRVGKGDPSHFERASAES
jgi:tRNA threonylcarbamoyl adenosine modification protein (Sua5/YciO/YrdC/YwlC family)